VATIGRMARLATMGDVDFSLAKFKDGDEQINIRVKVAQDVRRDLTAIGDVLVPGKAGLVPLRSVADIELGFGPVQLNRYDRARQVTFTANLGDVALGTAMERVMATQTMKALPATVTPDTQGESQIMADIFAGFMASIGLGVFLIYAVLVLLFGGFLHPLTIMGALPLSIGGALAGLLISGKELGMMALIGILMLMGLVTKNSILLVEYALRTVRDGTPRREALVLAGRDRIRPILMTTIAMIAGMLPIAFSLGTGTERLSPMAIAVVGGLVTSTLLTLVVVPAAFTIVDDVRGFFLGLLRGKIGQDPLEPAAPPPVSPQPVSQPRA
jgi:multidrug efflux pump subunit AcrB